MTVREIPNTSEESLFPWRNEFRCEAHEVIFMIREMKEEDLQQWQAIIEDAVRLR